MLLEITLRNRRLNDVLRLRAEELRFNTTSICTEASASS